MAEGLRCIRCGHQESTHLLNDPEVSPEDLLPGFRAALPSCEGFRPDAIELALVRAQIEGEEAWAGKVYRGREQTGGAILQLIVWPLLNGELGIGNRI